MCHQLWHANTDTADRAARDGHGSKLTRVLIIGASGAVGTHLTRQLTDQGQEVTGTCRSASKEGRIRSAGATPLVLDVLDAAATSSAMAHVRPDAIIYQATALAGMLLGKPDDQIVIHDHPRSVAQRHLATACSPAIRNVAALGI